MPDEPLDPELQRVVDAFAEEAVPSWPSLSVESAHRLEDELFGAGGIPLRRY
jgi:hypothetical protein